MEKKALQARSFVPQFLLHLPAIDINDSHCFIIGYSFEFRRFGVILVTMASEKGVVKYPETEVERAASLADMDAQIEAMATRRRNIKAETAQMALSNRNLEAENQNLLAVVSAVKERDFASMRTETGVLERAQNALQRDINISEAHLKKLRKRCQTTDMEFNAILVAIKHLSTANDVFEDEVQAELATLTPAAMQVAFELLQQTISDKLAQIVPEYVLQSACLTPFPLFRVTNP